MADEWANSYTAFKEWALANGYEDDLTIDRHPDNNGGYGPDNCRWATKKEQARNTRSNRELTAFGETKTIAEWAEDPRCAVAYQTLVKRTANGFDAETAITTPSRGGVFSYRR